MKKTISALLTLCLLAGLLSTLTGCSGSYPFKKGATVEATVQSGKDTKIGNSAKTGWELLIPDGVMENGTAVTMKVLSENEAKSYQSSDFTLYGTPIEVSGDGVHGVWFADPVPVTIKIPKEHLKDLAAEELFFAIHEDGAWRFFLANNVNLKDGTATFKASHFSLLGFGKPSEQEQLKTFAQTYAANEYAKQQKKENFKNAMGKQLDGLFKSMGVDSTNARNQLIMDTVAYLESEISGELLDADNPVKDFAPVDTLMRMAVAAEQGDKGKSEFNSKAAELYAKAIAYGVEKHVNANQTLYGIKDAQTGSVDKTAKAITVLGNLGTAAGAFAEGDTKGGLEAVGNMLTGLAGPKAALITATPNFAKDSVQEAGDNIRAYWTQSEIEEAYRLYTKPGGAFEGDFDGIFALKGNAEALINQRIIQAHCAKYGPNEDDLTPEARKALLNNAWKGLRGYFEQRKAAEPEIEKLRQEEEAFLAEMKKQGLLAAYNFKDYFGIDKRGSNYSIEERLRRLYTVRDAVLSCIDADKRDTLGNERLVRAMEQWVYWNEKGQQDQFYEYLRETGLYEEAISADPSYAWVLTQVIDDDSAEAIRKKNKNYAGVYEYSASYAQNHFSITDTYVGKTDTWYDPDMLHGETSTFNASYSKPPETIQAGELISITVSLSAADINLSFFDASAHVRPRFGKSDESWQDFVDEQGKRFSFTSEKKNNYASCNKTVTTTAPDGREGETFEIKLNLDNGSIALSTTYVYEWKEAG